MKNDISIEKCGCLGRMSIQKIHGVQCSQLQINRKVTEGARIEDSQRNTAAV